jgi:hypothetical protein
VYAALSQNAEFRVRFADQVFRNYFGNGPLTPKNAEARWLARASEIDRAIVGESARWGDFRREPPYTRDAEWIAEQNRLRMEYFPQRTDIVVAQLREVGMYPSIDPPGLEVPNGFVEAGFELLFSTPLGKTHFTLDGSDPRLEGGAVSASSQLDTGEPIRLAETTRVRARALHQGEWSALNDTLIRVGPEPALRISEIMYHPAEPAAGSPFEADDLEFLEFQNTGAIPLELDGFVLDSGITFSFAGALVQQLAPGEHVVVVRNATAFAEVYGLDGVRLAGEYSGRLSNSGEELVLRRGTEEIILNFTYDDSWYPMTDGPGLSLVIEAAVIEDPNALPKRWGERTSWRPSRRPGGSPGSTDNAPPRAPNGRATSTRTTAST